MKGPENKSISSTEREKENEAEKKGRSLLCTCFDSDDRTRKRIISMCNYIT